MKTNPSYVHRWLTLAALPTMLWLAAPAGAQTVHQDDSSIQDRDGGDLDGQRATLANFDRFLDNHQELAEQVRKNPSLLNDRHFLSTHPALQSYLRDHVAVTQQLGENPNAFMEQENRYDRRGDFDAGRGGAADTRGPNGLDARRSGDVDARRAAVSEFDRYLDDHPQVAEQVRRDPFLLTNQEYLNNNPTLKAQIQDHPQVQQEIAQNPNAFMQAEARYDQRGDGGSFDARGGADADTRRDRDTRRAGVAEFDRYLDDHPKIADQVRRDPSLLTNREYLNNNPTLKSQIEYHPEVQQEIAQNPNAFMQAEARYDQRGDGGSFGARGGADADTRRGSDLDARRGAVAEFDRYLDDHPQTAEQVRRDPSLLTNQEYLNNNPTLKAQIEDHPQVQQEITQNPNVFMRSEARYDRRDDGGNPEVRSGDDLDGRRAAVANFDRFLDDHQEIAEQVRKNPSLVDNQQFVTTHPALQAYLQDHPTVTQQVTSNPGAFMQQENRYDQRENGMGRDTMRRQTADFGGFLGRHSNISQQLSHNPDLVKHKEYLASRPELQDYLNAHPDVQQALMQNPQSFVRSAQQYGTSNPTVKTPSNQTAPSTPTTKSTVPKL